LSDFDEEAAQSRGLIFNAASNHGDPNSLGHDLGNDVGDRLGVAAAIEHYRDVASINSAKLNIRPDPNRLGAYFRFPNLLERDAESLAGRRLAQCGPISAIFSWQIWRSDRPVR
jgi:hypothetical protein